MASLIRYGLIEFIVTAKKLQFFTSGLVAGCVGFAKLFVCATQPTDGELRLGDLRLEDVAGAVPSSPAYACAVFYPGSHASAHYGAISPQVRLRRLLPRLAHNVPF